MSGRPDIAGPPPLRRLSLEYVDYLEAVALSLLKEREDFGGVNGFRDSVGGAPFSYQPTDVRRRISQCRRQVAKIRWAELVEGHGFGVGVPADLAQQAGPGSWVKIQGKWEIEVRGTVATPKGPCLILSDDCTAVSERSVVAGMSILLD